MKLTLYVPGELGAVILKFSTKAPELVWSAWSMQVAPLIFQLVDCQSLAPPPPEVVVVMETAIELEGGRVTLAEPSRVTELMVLAANAGEGKNAETATAIKNPEMSL